MKEWVLTPNRFLSKEELGKLLKRAEELRSLGVAKSRRQAVRDWMIIRLTVFSGLRAVGDLCPTITDCHIGYSRSDLHVRCGKGGKARLVKVGPELKRDLRWYLRWKPRTASCIPKPSCCEPSDPSGSHGAPCGGAGTATVRSTACTTPGTLRLHCYMKQAEDLRLVQKQLGHSRPSITAVYADVCDEKAREGVAAMEQLAKRAIKAKSWPRQSRTSPPLTRPPKPAPVV